MRQPLVAIVGRPNVGKSTLVNRIAVSKQAIVDEKPGATRDRNYIEACWRGKTFILIDTGGLDFNKGKLMAKKVVKQALLAAQQADVIVFVVDGKEGLVSDDYEIASVLRASGKPVTLVVNKVDSLTSKQELYDFYRLGLSDPFEISSLHGLGTDDLLDRIVSLLPSTVVESPSAELHIAIVGRPNVGKSSLFNKLLGYERAIVNEASGTTRDAIDTIIEMKGKKYRFIDTAGLKKRSRISQDVDYYGFVRTLKALGQANVALIVFDATEALVREDLRITNLAFQRGCASLILLNKWDLVRNRNPDDLVLGIRRKTEFLRYIPVCVVSALTGFGLDKVFPAIEEIAINYRKRVPTAQLNNFVRDLIVRGREVIKKGRKLKIFYATQAEEQPPLFVFFVNYPELVSVSYRRYLERSLREVFGFAGCPIRIRFRRRQ